jgi:arylsulfatase A-like enzyme
MSGAGALNARISMTAALAVAATLIAGQGGCGVLAADQRARPNILFILADDHAAGAVGCYGSKINKTPHLDRIAQGGMRFANCFCTNSVCAPSRAVILTGRYSHSNGVRRNGDRFDGSQETVQGLLRAAGYQTALVGKWHLETDPTGFDHWQILIGQGPYHNPPLIDNGRRVKLSGYTTDLLGDLAIEYLKNGRDRAKPFLLMWQHKAPHREWQPAERHLALFKDAEIAPPANLFDDYSGRASPARLQEMQIDRDLTDIDLKLTPPRGLDESQLAAWKEAYEPENEFLKRARFTREGMTRWKYQRYIKNYLRCVAALDENVGRVLDLLDETGLAANTVVIYASDQGFFLGEHGWFDKRFMYEESMRQPLLVRWPGRVEPGTVNNDLVSNLDFAPTLLELAGVQPPAAMQGRSLAPLLAAKPPNDWRTSHYYHYYEYPSVHRVHKHCGVRTARHKLIHFYETGEWELYDLNDDPREMTNLYNEPASAPLVRTLKAELKRLQARYQVPAADLAQKAD